MSRSRDGPLMSIAPTHKHVSWLGITIDRVVDGKIVENWVSWDMAGMLEQLGAIPATV
jgi:predicted ester cyclase